jgi:hypothetical protein
MMDLCWTAHCENSSTAFPSIGSSRLTTTRIRNSKNTVFLRGKVMSSHENHPFPIETNDHDLLQEPSEQ